MHHAYTLLVMASIIASAPTYASGSCLSYGHSCWGAHGKRSGDLQTPQVFASKLAPSSMSERQGNALLTEYLLSQLRPQQRNPDDEGDTEVEKGEVIFMEQPSIYRILSDLARNNDGKLRELRDYKL